ncbi:MAG: polysaccharide biosynthesis protein [Actinomycetes bacterium]
MRLARPAVRRRSAGLWSGLPARAARIRGEIPFALLDIALVVVCNAAVLLYRYGGGVSGQRWADFRTYALVACALVLVVHGAFGLYGNVWRYAGVAEARRLLVAGLVTSVLLATVVLLGDRLVPLSVAMAGAFLTTMVLGLVRFQARLFAHRRAVDRGAVQRVVVVGAGTTAAHLVGEMLAGGTLEPVAILAADRALAGRRIRGVPVAGTPGDLLAVCRQVGAHQVLVALHDPPRTLIRELADDAEAAGALLRLAPPVATLASSQVGLADVRDVRIEDLLGREPVRTDLAAVARLVSGRTVLVTGAGGSIGSEICRQVARLGPDRLLMLDHDESLLYDVAADVGPLGESMLADLRDGERVRRLVLQVRPDVVFHAAAHKHVPILETHPGEAVATNVAATADLVAACVAAGVPRFVAISTDKAVRPSSVMGATKKIAEHVVISAADPAAGRAYALVRFGNVLGSRGSVVPTFTRQIAAGGPVTVTDPRMTRYFMTIPEAVQLVLQAAAMARGGEAFMLDMGEPVPIADLARRMIRLSGRRVGTDVELVFTGCRPGEKLVEQLREPEETPHPTTHPAIVRLVPRRPDDDALRAGLDELVQRARSPEPVESLRRRVVQLARDVEAWPAREPAVPAPRPPAGTDRGERWSHSTT